MLQKVLDTVSYIRSNKIRMALFLIAIGIATIHFGQIWGVAVWFTIFFLVADQEIRQGIRKSRKEGCATVDESVLWILSTMFRAVAFVAFGSIIGLSYAKGNPWWAAVVGLNAYMTDAAAMLAGGWLKKRNVRLVPIWEEANEGKSWQSSITAIIIAAPFCCYAVPIILFMFPIPHDVPLYVFVAGSIGAIAGDLTESRFKRVLGIKDSGGIFGSHGGFLDRCDSLIGTTIMSMPFIFFTFLAP